MATRLLIPFHSLSADSFISKGSAGQVFAVSGNVIFKCPTLFENPAPPQAKEMIESTEKMNREKAIHQILQKRRHKNIVHNILCVPEGLFMQRLETTLELRISKSSHININDSTQSRWIQQLTSGTAWLEKLGYVHGDLRPANVLVDTTDDLHLTDFDATVRIGKPLLVASEPFCKLNVDYELPMAGSESEQFSLASCFYTIRFGRIPFHNIDAPTRVQKLIRNEYPSTSQDILFGDLIQACWRGNYPSIEAIIENLPHLNNSPISSNQVSKT